MKNQHSVINSASLIEVLNPYELQQSNMLNDHEEGEVKHDNNTTSTVNGTTVTTTTLHQDQLPNAVDIINNVKNNRTTSERTQIMRSIITPWMNYFDTLKTINSSYLVEDYVLQTYTATFPVTNELNISVKEKNKRIQSILFKLRSLSTLTYHKSRPTNEQIQWMTEYQDQLKYATLCIFIPIIHANSLRDWCNGYTVLDDELKKLTESETKIAEIQEPAITKTQQPLISDGSPLTVSTPTELDVLSSAVVASTDDSKRRSHKKRKAVSFIDVGTTSSSCVDITSSMVSTSLTAGVSVPIAPSLDYCSIFMNKRSRLDIAKNHLLKYQSHVEDITKKLEFALNDRIPFWTERVIQVTKEYNEALVNLKATLDKESSNS